MSDEKKLIEEAARIAHVAWYDSDSPQSEWANVATALRTFWASHAEPAEVDTAKALEEALKHMMRRLADPFDTTGIDYGTAISILEEESHRVNQQSREDEQAKKLGQAVATRFAKAGWAEDERCVIERPIRRHDADMIELGRFILDQIEASQ